MPKRVKNFRKIMEMPEAQIDPESRKLQTNREYRFREILGEDFPPERIFQLVESKVDYHDLEELVKSGCPPVLALDILE